MAHRKGTAAAMLQVRQELAEERRVSLETHPVTGSPENSKGENRREAAAIAHEAPALEGDGGVAPTKAAEKQEDLERNSLDEEELRKKAQGENMTPPSAGRSRSSSNASEVAAATSNGKRRSVSTGGSGSYLKYLKPGSFKASVIGDDSPEDDQAKNRALGRDDFKNPFNFYLYRLNHLPVIDPKSTFRITWDLAAVVLIVYTIFSLPFNLAFFWQDSESQDKIIWDVWTVIDLFIDIYFLTDVILNFNTGYIIEKDEITVLERDRITVHYLRTWFVFDFFSSIPFDFLVLGDRSSAVWRVPRLLRLFRISRLLRLMRLGRMIRYVARFEFFSRMSVNPLRIGKLFSAAVIFCHWNACIQWLVVEIEKFPEESWAVRDGVMGSSNFDCYSNSLFRAISHMLCIGYGATPPSGTTEVLVTTVSMLVGASLFACFVGIIATLIMQSDQGSVEYERRVDELNRFMAYRKLDLDLRDKLRRNFEYRWKTCKVLEEARVLEGLPESLRTEVQMTTCQHLVETVPFFEGADPGFLADIVSFLRPVIFLPDELIIREGQTAFCMYFLREGDVAVEAKGVYITRLHSGSYFGEIGIVNKVKRTASIRAVTVCDVYILDKDSFDSVMVSNTDNLALLERIAQFRLRHLNLNLNKGQKRPSLTSGNGSEALNDESLSAREGEVMDGAKKEEDSAWAKRQKDAERRRTLVMNKLEAAEHHLELYEEKNVE